MTNELSQWWMQTLNDVRAAIDYAYECGEDTTNAAAVETLRCLAKHPEYGRDHQFRDRISTIRKQFENGGR